MPPVYEPLQPDANRYLDTATPVGCDPDRAARLRALQARQQNASAQRQTRSASPTNSTARSSRVNRRNHPARTARTVALAGSVAATAALAFHMAADDRVAATDTIVASASASDEAPEAQDQSLASVPALVVEAPVAELVPDSTSGQVATSGYADGTFVGSAEFTKWGDLQVQATISGGQLVAVDVVQAPDDRKSEGINNRAVPSLSTQALSLQDANIDNVSGATWTSRTYKASLQSALDQALEQGTTQ